MASLFFSSWRPSICLNLMSSSLGLPLPLSPPPTPLPWMRLPGDERTLMDEGTAVGVPPLPPPPPPLWRRVELLVLPPPELGGWLEEGWALEEEKGEETDVFDMLDSRLLPGVRFTRVWSDGKEEDKKFVKS